MLDVFSLKYTLHPVQLAWLILTLRFLHLLKVVVFKTSPHPKSYKDIFGAC